MTAAETCPVCGSTKSPVANRLGEANYGSKLANEEVLAIRRRYAEGGVTQIQLANEYEISKTQVSRIINHQRWRHI